MKLIKLNRRYKAYKDYGHTYGFRFNSWNKYAGLVERAMTDVLGNQYKNWNSYEWKGTFGSRSKVTGSKPYFITFRDESIATVVMLKLT